jgi:hypothetical protein
MLVRKCNTKYGFCHHFSKVVVLMDYAKIIILLSPQTQFYC